MSLAIIPLAITMNAGPQIMSAIIFVTASKPLKLSAYFMAGVVIAVTVGVTVTYTLATVLGNSISLGDPSDSGSIGNIIQYLLVGLLVILSIRSYLTRATSEPPRASLRSVFTIMAESAAFTCRVSSNTASKPASLKTACSHCESGPASSPIRVTVRPSWRTNPTSASGSLATLASRTILPVASTTHTLLRSSDTSIPA